MHPFRIVMSVLALSFSVSSLKAGEMGHSFVPDEWERYSTKGVDDEEVFSKPELSPNHHVREQQSTASESSDFTNLASVINGGCPNPFARTVTVEVFIRYFAYNATAAELVGKSRSELFLTVHSPIVPLLSDTVHSNVALMNSYFGKWDPRIRFVLAGGHTERTAGVWHYWFKTAAGYRSQVIDAHDYSDTSLENETANHCRGKLEQRPKDQNRQLWIYAVNYISDEVMGFSYQPKSSKPKATDGIFIRTEYFPKKGYCDLQYYDPAFLSHEAGHWLDVYDIFEGGCGSPNDEFHGDRCEMTPSWTSNKPPNSCPAYGVSYASQRNPCNSSSTPTDIEVGVSNIMSYSRPLCRTTFTADQAARMWKTALQVRGFVPTCGLPKWSPTIRGECGLY